MSRYVIITKEARVLLLFLLLLLLQLLLLLLRLLLRLLLLLLPLLLPLGSHQAGSFGSSLLCITHDP
jgi:hypothetical protein